MRPHAVLPILLLALAGASNVSAMELHLRWGACGAEGAGDRVFACDTNEGADTLVASVTTAAPSDVVMLPGVRVTLMLVTPRGIPRAPAWWELAILGTCRPTALMAEPPTAPQGGCAAFFLPSQSVAVSFDSFGFDFDHSGNYWTRWFVDLKGMDRPLEMAPSGTEFALARLIVRHDRTVGDGACAGCSTPLWISLESAGFFLADGTLVGVGGTASATSSVTWSPLLPTPARSTTWGAIKSLYR